MDIKTRLKTGFFYIVFEDLQGIDGGDENRDDETCRNCAALQEELELCKAKAAQDLQRLKEEMAEERKRNGAERDALEKKVLKLNNELSDVRRESGATTYVNGGTFVPTHWPSPLHEWIQHCCDRHK